MPPDVAVDSVPEHLLISDQRLPDFLAEDRILELEAIGDVQKLSAVFVLQALEEPVVTDVIWIGHVMQLSGYVVGSTGFLEVRLCITVHAAKQAGFADGDGGHCLKPGRT